MRARSARERRSRKAYAVKFPRLLYHKRSKFNIFSLQSFTRRILASLRRQEFLIMGEIKYVKMTVAFHDGHFICGGKFIPYSPSFFRRFPFRILSLRNRTRPLLRSIRLCGRSSLFFQARPRPYEFLLLSSRRYACRCRLQ